MCIHTRFWFVEFIDNIISNTCGKYGGTACILVEVRFDDIHSQ